HGGGLDRCSWPERKRVLDGIELWLGANPWLQPTTTDQQVADLLRRVKNAGLVVSNVSNTFDWDFPISSRDPKIREQACHDFERQIAIAPMLETDAILMVAGLVTSEVPYSEVYPRTVEGVQRLAEQAGRAKVRIGCENCCSEQRFLMSPREFGLFLD